MLALLLGALNPYHHQQHWALCNANWWRREVNPSRFDSGASAAFSWHRVNVGKQRRDLHPPSRPTENRSAFTGGNCATSGVDDMTLGKMDRGQWLQEGRPEDAVSKVKVCVWVEKILSLV